MLAWRLHNVQKMARSDKLKVELFGSRCEAAVAHPRAFSAEAGVGKYVLIANEVQSATTLS